MADADHNINLDTLLIQLKPAVLHSDKWYQFGKALGTKKELLEKCTQLQPDQSLVQILDDWLRNHSGQPSWNEIAEALTEIGLEQHALDIKSVYETGMKQKVNRDCSGYDGCHKHDVHNMALFGRLSLSMHLLGIC